MSIDRNIPFCALLVIVLGSCSPSYVPNARNVPMFTRAGEVAAAAGVSINPPELGLEAQVAYAVTDHIAVMANGSGISHEDQVTQHRDQRTHYFGELGAGYYLRTEKFRFEVFGGYGKGKSTGYTDKDFVIFGNDAVLTTGKYDRIFFQPSIGTDQKQSNFSFTARISAVRFNSFTTADPNASTNVLKPSSDYQLFLEPVVTSTFHIRKNFRFFFQAGLSGPLGHKSYFDYSPFLVTAGIQFHTSEKHNNEY